MNNLPLKFIERINNVYGLAGKTWLEDFTDLRIELRNRWDLTGSKPIPEFSLNYIEYAKDPAGKDVVLKMGVPNPELKTEIAALEMYAGKGSVKLLDSDREKGALLLERILPGHDLLSVCDDENATRIAGQVMIDLWCPAPETSFFPTMGKWCEGFERYRFQFQENPGPLRNSMVKRASDLAEELLQDSTEATLLHGDLHHFNILIGPAGNWMATDPKGVIGEKPFEICPYLSNPIPDLIKQSNPGKLIKRRLDILSETTHLDHSRMLNWSYVRAMLSAIWNIEDRVNNWGYHVTIAEILMDLV